MSYISSYSFGSGSSSRITSFNARIGAVVSTDTDYTATQIKMTPVAPHLSAITVQDNMALINTKLSDYTTFKNTFNVANSYLKLNSEGKIDESLISISGGLVCKGTFDATLNQAPTNSPSEGWYYIAQGSGSFNGISLTSSDWALYINASWQKVEGSNVVDSSDVVHTGYHDNSVDDVKGAIDDLDENLELIKSYLDNPTSGTLLSDLYYNKSQIQQLLQVSTTLADLAIYSTPDLNNSTKTLRYASTSTPLTNGNNFLNCYYSEQNGTCNLIVNFSLQFGNSWSSIPNDDYVMIQNDSKTVPMPTVTIGDMFFGWSFMAYDPTTGLIQTPLRCKVTPQGIYFKPAYKNDYLKGSDIKNADLGMIFGTISISFTA